MSSSTLIRASLLISLATATAAVPIAARQISPPAYTDVATLPDRIDGQPLRTFIFDSVARRLYTGSDRGLYFADLDDPNPHLTGPLIRKDILKIDVAPELGRVFYTTADEVGYVDVRNNGGPMPLLVGKLPLDLVYEPTRQEVYVTTRDPQVLVFDAKSGERGPAIDLPGWWGVELEAMPGRVFLTVGGKNGLYAIDAATHRVEPFPVHGRIVTPATLEADPAGKHLFLAYDREVVAIDVATHDILGRVIAPVTPRIAYDPGTDTLIATWDDDPPPTRVVALRVQDGRFAEVGRYPNPAIGRTGVEPTNRGFIQAGNRAIIVWSAASGAAFAPAEVRR